jgi:hypothetical protein
MWGEAQDWPQNIVHVLGRATVVERGDAANGRSQVCYKSADPSEPTKLIFEIGECTHSFYLFAGGAPFSGTDKCQGSNIITRDLKTPNGLGLGLTPEQVKKILGPPSAAEHESLTYDYNVKLTRTKQRLEELKREAGPEYGPPDLQIDDGLSILIKFHDARSWYLYVASSSC